MADKLLLEDGSGGIQLEDGSGVMLLEGGDPVLSPPMQKMLPAILSAFCAVTVTPFFASVVLAHTGEPPVVHPSRQVETQAVVRSLHPEPDWPAQSTRKLPISITAVPVDAPPVSSRKYAGEWPIQTWEAQARQKLVPLAALQADEPPPSSVESLYGPLASHYAPATVTPLWASTLTAEGSSAPVNDPPFSQAKYRGEWPPQTWETQSRSKLVPIPPAQADPPPFSPPKYRGDWPWLEWPAQTRPHLTPGSEISQPPSGKKYTGDWPVQTWEAQSRPKLVPTIQAVVNDPPITQRKYTGEWPQLTWDAQTRPKLVPIPPAPVDNPPPANLDAIYGPLASHYIPPTVTPLWAGTLTSEGQTVTPVDDPPPTQPRYRGDWPLPTWETQTRPKLIQAGAPPAPVDDPPFTMRVRQAQPISAQWLPRALTGISLARWVERVDDPPPTQPRYRGDWPLPTWETQTRPKLIQAGAPPAPVDNPPFTMRVRQAQPIAAQWLPRALTGISLARWVERVDDPPFAGKKYTGEWPVQTWDAQTRPKLIQAGAPPALVDNPPFAQAKYRGEWLAPTWDTQARPKLVPIPPAVVNDPPATQRKYAGEWPPLTWESQRARTLPVSITAVPVHGPPFSGKKYRGEWPPLTWEAQARPRTVPIPTPPVIIPPFALIVPVTVHVAPETVLDLQVVEAASKKLHAAPIVRLDGEV